MNYKRIPAILASVALALGSLIVSTPQAHAAKAYKISIAASATRVPDGVSVTISGKVNLKSKSKRTVKVQYRYAGTKTWKTARSVTATKTGRFTLSIAAIGDVSWRACKAKDKKGKAKCSKTLSITTYTPPTAPSPTPTSTTSTPPVTVTQNAAGASTVPDSTGDYNWTTETTRWSQRHIDEAAGYSLGAAANGTPALTATSVSPATGPMSGGTIVTITGTGLDSVTGAKMVKQAWTTPPIGDDAEGESWAEDSVAVRFKRINATTLQIVTPAWGWGASKLVLTNSANTAAATYTYKLDAGAGNSIWEQAILTAINAKRASGVTCGHGTVMPAVPPITLSSLGSDYARVYANDLVARGSSVYNYKLAAHVRSTALRSGDAQAASSGVSASGGYAREVLGGGLLTSVSPESYGADVVDGWINEVGNATDGHCTTLMASNITSIGIGVAIRDTGSATAVARVR